MQGKYSRQSCLNLWPVLVAVQFQRLSKHFIIMFSEENVHTFCPQAETIRQPKEVKTVLHKAEEAFLKSLEACKRLGSSVDNKELLVMRTRLLLNIGFYHYIYYSTARASLPWPCTHIKV